MDKITVEGGNYQIDVKHVNKTVNRFHQDLSLGLQ